MSGFRVAARSMKAGRRRPREFPHSSVRWCHGLLLLFLAGCGSYFEPGDEAWVELPGAMPQFNEYAVVEVVAFKDGRARIELIERLPVVEGQRMSSDSKSPDARKMLKRMNDRGSAWVAEDAAHCAGGWRA